MTYMIAMSGAITAMKVIDSFRICIDEPFRLLENAKLLVSFATHLVEIEGRRSCPELSDQVGSDPVAGVQWGRRGHVLFEIDTVKKIGPALLPARRIPIDCSFRRPGERRTPSTLDPTCPSCCPDLSRSPHRCECSQPRFRCDSRSPCCHQPCPCQTSSRLSMLRRRRCWNCHRPSCR